MQQTNTEKIATKKKNQINPKQIIQNHGSQKAEKHLSDKTQYNFVKLERQTSSPRLELIISNMRIFYCS